MSSTPLAGSDLAAPHRLILVRHGQTPHTAAMLISGAGFQPEPELDPSGQAQARAAGRRLAEFDVTIDEVFASPLLRAQQTASIIAGGLGIRQVVTAGPWSEAHFGDWEGLSVAEVVDRFPGSWETMIADPANHPPGGESLTEVRTRVVAAWRSVARPGRTTLVVTHLTPIRIVVAEALATPHEAFPRVMAGPGSITVIDRWADGGVAVMTLGERPRVELDQRQPR